MRSTARVSKAASSLPAPDESQRKLMAELAITFQDGVYRLGACRYERLADAVSYARLQSATLKS